MEMTLTRRCRTTVLGTALALLLVAPAGAGLRDEIEIQIRRAQLSGATVAVSVRDAATGTVLIDENAGEMMIPASNLKLFTSGAALHVLGPDFEFRTRAIIDGERLVIVGDGDPGFGDPELLKLMQ